MPNAKDDFIMTIDEDEMDVTMESSDDEARLKTANTDFNGDFLFDADSSFQKAKFMHPWDFASAKLAIGKARNGAYTSVDDKIAKLKAPKQDLEDEMELVSNSDGSNSEVASDDDSDDGLDGVDVAMESDLDAASDDQDEATSEAEDVEKEEEELKDSEDSEEEGDNVKTTRREESSEEEEPDFVKDKKKAAYFEQPEPEPETMVDITFQHMNLSRPLLKSITALGFTKPTQIQAKTIPLAMQGKDICGSAVTGSGKTAAFMLPVLERLIFRPRNPPLTRVLVLVPTRELGVQCHSVGQNLAKYTDIQFCLCVGGLSSKLQELELRKRPDVVIATPGRLIDHLRNSVGFNLDSIEILIMDEADRMLEDGFQDELKEIIRHTPKTRQTMLFSATMTDNVRFQCPKLTTIGRSADSIVHE
jgi:ATP-dependent RNA helicase DDX27